MRFFAALALLVLASTAQASLSWHRKFDSLLGELAKVKLRYTGAFTLWIQLVNKDVEKRFFHLLDDKNQHYTILLPNTTAFDQWITANGGNASEIDDMGSQPWKDRFSDIYPYFFFDGALNTSAVEPDKTVVLNSLKTSPVGNWPLPIAFRRDPALIPDAAALKNKTAWAYNGTFYSTPYGFGDVSMPAHRTNDGSMANVLPYVPTIPKNLSVTATDLGIPEWTQLAARVPAAAALETSYNYTLLLPPSSAIATALSGSDISLESFFHAHLIPSRLVLSSKAQTFTLYTGTEGTATSETITVGERNTTVVKRDVLTNGIVVQVIDQALTDVTAASSTVAHREL
ncbi:hypothetical protein JCM8097_002327 [Rhodosporidiobolus ruineniae]